jgi:putative PIN family toxin of toxin-antitoxin system
MRVIVDTNVVISAVISENSIPDIVFNRVFLKYSLLCSNPVFNEYEDRLMLPKFDKYTSIERRISVLNDIKRAAIFFNPLITITDCRDPKDNKFLELAIAANADCIVSGDKDLRVLNPFRGIKIISPGDFLIQF